MDQRMMRRRVNSIRNWESKGTMSKDKPEKRAPSPGPLPGEEVDWRDRCMSLEASLQQFKTQVVRIRETLGEKVGLALLESIHACFIDLSEVISHLCMTFNKYHRYQNYNIVQICLYKNLQWIIILHHFSWKLKGAFLIACCLFVCLSDWLSVNLLL